MKKLITLLILLSAAASLSAVDFNYDGINYTILSEDDKTCEVKASEFPIPGTQVEGDIVIPETVEYQGESYTVTRIGKLAFFWCGGLSSVTIPNTVVSIGEAAFEMTGLNSVVLPNSVKELDRAVFNMCRGLYSVTLSESLTTIGQFAFSGCEWLMSIEIPNSVTLIGEGAFAGCSNLTSVTLSESLTSLGKHFERCNNLKSITIPASVTSISEDAFKGMDGLEEIVVAEENETYSSEGCVLYNKDRSTLLRCPPAFEGSFNIPESVTSIQKKAFAECSGLTSVTIPTSVTSIGEYAFNGCTGLTAVVIPDSVTEMGEGVFKDCSGLTSLAIPNSVTEIPSQAFAGCSSLASVKIPDSVVSIGGYAFYGCDDMRSITIPASVTDLGSALEGCSGLKEILVAEGSTTYSSVNGILYNKDRTVLICCPGGIEGSIEILDTATTIGYRAFWCCRGLTSIVIPNTVTEILSAAFNECSGLTYVEIPESVTSIGYGIFMSCSSLTSIEIPNSVTSIGEGAFAYCSGLTSIDIPEGVTSIGALAFNNCSALTSVDIPEGVTSIGEDAFSNCSALTSISIPKSLVEIKDRAFSDCPNISKVQCLALNPPTLGSWIFSDEVYATAELIVPAQSLEKYRTAESWNKFVNISTVSGTVALSHTEVGIAADEVFQLGVYGATGEVKWSTSDPTVAYANECGLVVAMGVAGTAEITATVDGEQVSCTVNVTAQSGQMSLNMLTDGVAADNQPVDIIIESIGGNPPMVNARLIPVGSATVIDWTSSDESVASVDHGLVTVFGTGEVEFGTKTQNGLSKAMIKNIDEGFTSISDVISEGNDVRSGDVYDLTGRRVLVNATPGQLKQLDRGIYIVGGKKVLVK